MFNYKLVVFALLTIGSVVGVREYLKPRDIEAFLKWNGIGLINNNEAWESSFFEHEEELANIGVKSFKELSGWCSARFKDDLSDPSKTLLVEKYCQDNPKTIFGNIIRTGERARFIDEKDEEAFKVAYVISENQDELKKAMEIKSAEENDMGKEVAKWCNSQKKSKIKDAQHLSNVKKYCYNKNVKKISDLLSKQGFKFLENDDDYKAKFNSLQLNKAGEEYVKEIQATTKPEVDAKEIKGEEGWKHLQLWCKSKNNEALTGNEVFPKLYSKVKVRCATN